MDLIVGNKGDSLELMKLRRQVQGQFYNFLINPFARQTQMRSRLRWKAGA
jgi:hypothetical protein